MLNIVVFIMFIQYGKTINLINNIYLPNETAPQNAFLEISNYVSFLVSGSPMMGLLFGVWCSLVF